MEAIVLTLVAQQHLSLAAMRLRWSGAGTELDRWSGPEGRGGTRRFADTSHVCSAEIPAGKTEMVSGV